jgi:Mlc titration factor MtfA (ptsG expression regulator)
VRVTGIDVKIDDTDRILVAASAIIPIFAFKDWKYKTIDEVLLYPNSFNEKFETKGPDRNILGMVGDGHLNGTMILSKPALIQGFLNETDKNNTAIHEFVHLIDKTDGAIDGFRRSTIGKQYAIPWIELISKKLKKLIKAKSDINPYGGTSQIEFLAVASEYFFERPHLLESKHPELYEMMEQMFQQEMSAKTLERQKNKIGRNDPCPCNKGKKFKNCCWAVHFS